MSPDAWLDGTDIAGDGGKVQNVIHFLALGS